MWVEKPNMPTLEDGVRSWPTWLSARSPRNRPQELMRMLETLDSRCWPLLTRLRKPKSLMPKSLTEDLRWWPSSACFSRRGYGFCAHAYCLLRLNKKRNTTKSVAERVQQCRASAQQNQHRWRKKHNSVSIGMACSEFMKIISCQPRFQHTACLIVWYCSYCYNLHICLPIRGCRMCRAWIVSWCDMHRLYNWYNAFEACTKTWYFHIRYFSFCLYINHIVYTHCLRLHIISRHNISYHFILYLVISCHIMSYHIISYHIRIISWFF